MSFSVNTTASNLFSPNFAGQKYNEAYYLQQFSPADRQKIQQNKASYTEALNGASSQLLQAVGQAIDLYGSSDIEAAAKASTTLENLDPRFAIGGPFYEVLLLKGLLKKQLP